MLIYVNDSHNFSTTLNNIKLKSLIMLKMQHCFLVIYNFTLAEQYAITCFRTIMDSSQDPVRLYNFAIY